MSFLPNDPANKKKRKVQLARLPKKMFFRQKSKKIGLIVMSRSAGKNLSSNWFKKILEVIKPKEDHVGSNQDRTNAPFS